MRSNTPKQTEFLRKEKRKIRPKRQLFNPNREEITKATQEYLKRGGTIKQIELLPEMSDYRDMVAVYEFLRG